MKEVKVLLLSPGKFYTSDEHIFKAHLHLLYSFLYKKVQVDVLDLEVEIGSPESQEDLPEFIKSSYEIIGRHAFDIAAISCWSSLNYISTLAIAQVCRKVNPKAIIVVGGYHPSALPQDFCFEDKLFDFIIRGDGERLLAVIATAGLKKPQITKILYDRYTFDRRLDEDFDLVWDSYRYAKNERRNIGIVLSRGCPYACSFCMEGSKGRGWKAVPAEKAAKIIEDAYQSVRPRSIFIYDACFGLNKGWRHDFLGALTNKEIRASFWLETRIDLLTKKDIDLLSKLKVKVFLGLESASEDMLKLMNKTPAPKSYLHKFREVTRYMDEKQVFHEVAFLFNHPGETTATIEESSRFMENILEEKKSTYMLLSGSYYAFYPGSRVFRDINFFEEQFGTIILHKEWWKMQKVIWQDTFLHPSQAVIPSKELLATRNLDLWRKKWGELFQINVSKIAPELREDLQSLVSVKK